MRNDQCVIAVDVDGVLAQESDKPYSDKDPYPDAIKRINNLYDQGYIIVLYTARYMLRFNGNLEKVRRVCGPELAEWAKRHGLKYHAIEHKISADLYIDDRAVRLESKFGEHDWIGVDEQLKLLKDKVIPE